MKAAETETFLDRDLLPQVETELALNADEERAVADQLLTDDVVDPLSQIVTSAGVSQDSFLDD